METIAVIARQKHLAEFIKADLEQYFAPYAQILAYSVDEIDQVECLEASFVVMSALTVFRKVQPKMREDAITQVVGFDMAKDNVEKLKEIPVHQKVLMMNIDYKMCMQVIAQIYDLGYRDFEFVPYYGDEEQRDPSIEIGVTPGEFSAIPDGLKQIIDIGPRPIDLNSIVELANKMGIEDIFSLPSAKEARKRFVRGSFGIDRVLSDKKDKNEQIKTLVELIQDGILLTDTAGVVLMSNRKATAILKSQVDGFNVEELLPELKISTEGAEVSDKVVELDGRNIIIEVCPIWSDEQHTGNIITLKSFAETEAKQHDIRNRIVKGNHSARYTFENIIGESSQMQECVSVARRMAKSDSSVLITGESGTGKEVFAQSIHNASDRSRRNFVAINCAAIPENLLESELFGYEEGAFTGAKKGGKIGYFELAHQGTLFLDEIGEMPITLQSKLLRVLEEKVVTRIGSSKPIHVDVRIIAATNKDLLSLVEGKEFREDLYYRINVLPLTIPPLRQRKKDILLLFEHFQRAQNVEFSLSDKAREMLLCNQWKGNIRQLKNVVEYLSSLGKTEIQPEDLPEDIKMGPLSKGFSEGPLVNHEEIKDRNLGELRNFIYMHWNNRELYSNVLQVLFEASTAGVRIGRRQLAETFSQRGLPYTEAEIRTCLTKLSSYDFIRSAPGRGGSVIISRGIALLDELKGLMGQ